MKLYSMVLLLVLSCGAAIWPGDARAGRFGRALSSSHPHSTPHATPHSAPEGHTVVVRPHISSNGDEQEDEQQQIKAGTSSGGSGINMGYLMLGLAGPLLFIAFRLRKFFRLRNNKNEREAEFAQHMLQQHGRTPQTDAVASAMPQARPAHSPAPAAAVQRMADGSDIDAFIRQARASFLHLRTLNQAMNGEEIRNYLSPALVEKLRPGLPKNAEAVKFPILKAELLESSQDGDGVFARLRFFGTVKLSPSAPVFEFAETWAFRKASVIDNWQVTDIVREAAG